MKVEGNKIVLSFDDIGGGLVAKGDALKRFAIAGEDKNLSGRTRKSMAIQLL